MFRRLCVFVNPFHARHVREQGLDFRPSKKTGLLTSYLLQPGGHQKGGYFLILFEPLITGTGRVEKKLVRECLLVPGPVTFPRMTARDIQIDEDLREAIARLEQSYPYV